MDSQIIEELKVYASGPWNPQQKVWYEQRLKDARPVQCVKMREALSVSSLAVLRDAGYHAERKGCYKNAAMLVDFAHFYGLEPEMRYVEGLALDPALPISIEHAWVRVGDLYIDPTAERCLHADVSKWEYVALVEKTWDELAAILVETGYYGDVYRRDFIKKLTK